MSEQADPLAEHYRLAVTDALIRIGADIDNVQVLLPDLDHGSGVAVFTVSDASTPEADKVRPMKTTVEKITRLPSREAMKIDVLRREG